jgi:hypothetical protein
VFGIIRPCRHRLGGELGLAWQAHLCGMCLSLRDDHGQAARLATNYDGLVISVLAEAQADGAPERRTAGRCALRGMRKLDVAIGDCARLAATVSLVLASAKIRDHAGDGDGAVGRPGVRGAATALAGRWAAASARTGRELGFEVAVLTDAVGRQVAVEAAAGPGTPLVAVTEPTEIATAAAFAYTSVLAGKPANEAPLAEAGRLFGRIAHLVDAVEDLAPDRAAGAWNPLLVTGADVAEARRLCDDALLGIKLALAEAEFTDARLVHALLVHELSRSVRRVFARADGTATPHRCAATPGTDGLSTGTPSTGALNTGPLNTGALNTAALNTGTLSTGAAHAVAAAAPLGCGLPAVAAITGLLSIRHRSGPCGRCCCDCGEDCCIDCSCDCCCDGCCEGCGDACCGSCDCTC